MVQLTEAHIELQHWRFLPTLMALFGAQTRMSAWERTLQSKEVCACILCSVNNPSIITIHVSSHGN